MRIYFYMFILLAVSAACRDDDSRKEETVSRTVLVYLGVDNNFAEEGAEKIETLRKAWRPSYTGNLLVYSDAGEAVLVWIHCNDAGENTADTVRYYGEEDSADKAVFKRVLTEVRDEYPADSYGLVVLSHASGWLPEHQLTRPASVIKDGNHEMEFLDFVEAIPMQLDFVIFDACFMGSIEVAYELKEKVKYVVASPAEVISPGFVYKNLLSHVMKPEADLIGVARDFYEYYNGLQGYWKSATVSVVKTGELDRLAALTAVMLKEAGDKEVDLTQVQSYGYASHVLYTDLGDYISKLLPARYEEFCEVLERSVVYKAHTPGYFSGGNYKYNEIHTFSGLAVYVPQARYPLLNQEYRKLSWFKAVNP